MFFLVEVYVLYSFLILKCFFFKGSNFLNDFLVGFFVVSTKMTNRRISLCELMKCNCW